MGGSSVLVACGNLFCYPPGVYGTLGTPAAGNIPSGRYGASNWTSGSGILWFFGGEGRAANGPIGDLNDLWEFNPSTNEWVWVSGSSTTTCYKQGGCGQPGIYGTLAIPAAGNIPGGRWGASNWTDSSGHLWLFAGIGYNDNGNVGYLNDLWEFYPSTNEWAWMGGSSTLSCGANNVCGNPGVYGTLGDSAPGNIPGSRVQASTWTDSSGNFWIFGGEGYDASGQIGSLNDLWEFSPNTNRWTWMGGSSSMNCGTDGCGQSGVYGSLGTPAAGNIPGGTSGAAFWVDKSGNFWLFGEGNQIWEFNPSNNEWAWMGGNETPGTYPGVYGKMGTPAAGNIPGVRSDAASWTDSSGNFWLLGGEGYDASGQFGSLNDLWEFSPNTKQWTWMGGSSSMNCGTIGNGLPNCGQYGVYGTLGMPAVGNIPGGRYGASSWTDSSGYLWLYGGSGFDANVSSGDLNDIWKYQPYAAAATPTFSVASGTYTSTQTVTITDPTPGLTIYYTTDGTTPATSSTVYSGPIIVSSTETLKAIATASGYVASAVATAAYTIPPDFTLAINPPSISVQAGQSGTATITVQDNGGFNSNVSFACTGLPTGAACSFTTQTQPTPAGVSYSTLTVTTAATTASLHRDFGTLFPGSVLAVVFCCFGWKRRRRLPMLLLLAAISVAGLTVLNGCGRASSTVTAHLPTISTVTVTATSGTLSHTATFSLTVN
jgi:N-acetylneuraminic acid mutarotase